MKRSATKTHQMTLDEVTAFEFFRDFSYCEYALKRAGLYRRDRPDAQPNWRCFAESAPVRRVLDNPVDPDLKDAIEYILEHPPKKQVREENGGLVWRRDRMTGTTSRQLLELVRHVRNNLFHGGKPNLLLGGSDGPDRDKELLKAGRQILHCCKEILDKEKNLGTNCSSACRRCRT